MVLLFGGTSEGRALAEWLTAEGIPAAVCVATEYGGTLLPDGVEARVGRLDGAGMEALMASRPFTRVVDATHPYAVEVTRNLRGAAERVGLPYHRLVREGPPEGDWLRAGSVAEAAELAQTLPGNLLLTTGSKELSPFAAPGLRERTFPRVLPTLDSLERCLALGFAPGHILCMQGPFSRRLNEAIIEQFAIRALVTKASGGAGGFWEKAEAARAAGCALIVIDRPESETGCSLRELKTLLLKEARERGAQ